MLGTIIRLNPGGFGFIAPADGGREVFFHCSELDGLEFDALLTERRVEYEVVTGDRGFRATNVRAAN